MNRYTGFRMLATSGAFLLCGGVLRMIDTGNQFSQKVNSAPFVIGGALLAIGLMVLVLAMESAPVSRVVAAFVAIGAVLSFGLFFSQLTLMPSIASSAPGVLDTNSPAIGLVLGTVVPKAALGLSVLASAVDLGRTRTIGRVPAVTLALGGTLSALPFGPSYILLGIGLIAVGATRGATSRSTTTAHA